jgi:hypothetical protein
VFYDFLFGSDFSCGTVNLLEKSNQKKNPVHSGRVTWLPPRDDGVSAHYVPSETSGPDARTRS